jgi:hypothetical protein
MKCEVVGWVFIDTDKPQVLVREGHAAAPQAMTLSETFAHQVVQTGAFRRGSAIVDPLTRRMIGYEMEALLTPLG